MSEIEVADVDRAAAKAWRAINPALCMFSYEVDSLTQAFARHRLAAAADVEAKVAEAVREERERIIKETRRLLNEYCEGWHDGLGIQENGPGGHGSCCTCATCKWDYDNCVCCHNMIEAELAKLSSPTTKATNQ